MSSDNRVHIELLPTGVPNLDSVLGGGLPALSLTIVAGGPGAGKTTLANQVLFHLGRPERPALYFSLLGEPLVKVLRYQQQFAFFDIGRVGRDVRYVDLAAVAREGTAADVLARVTDEVARHEPIVIALDSARAVEELDGGGGPTGRRAFSHDLSIALASWQTTSLLLGQYRRDELLGRPELSVADGLLWLERSLDSIPCPRELQVVNLRGREALPGKHPFRITATGLRIFPHRPATLSVAPAVGWARFGRPVVDELLGGGLPTGTSCLVTGDADGEATLLGLHFATAGAAVGETTVLLSFGEPPARLAQLARGVGWDLDALVGQGRLHFVAPRALDLSMDEVVEETLAAIEASGARRVVLHDLPNLALAVEPIGRRDVQIGLNRLLAELRARGITSVVISAGDDPAGGAGLDRRGLTFLADSVILVRAGEADGGQRRTLAVVKTPLSVHNPQPRTCRIGADGLILEPPAPAAAPSPAE